MLTRPLGELTWNTDGIKVCFADNDVFFSLDENKGIQSFSLSTGRGTVVWKSEYECLFEILATGKDRYFVGGDNGIGYSFKVLPGGEWQLERKRELLQYFNAAAFAAEKSLLAVCWYDLIRLVPLDGGEADATVDRDLNDHRIFSIEWVNELQEFLIVSPGELFLIGTTGVVRRLPSLNGEVLAAVNVRGRGQFVCALGIGDTVTVYMARYDDPQRPIWTKSFVQRPPTTTSYNSKFLSLSPCACLAFEIRRNDLVLAFMASIRRITLTGEITQTVQLPFSTRSLCISPDEEHLVVGAFAGTYVLNRNGEMVRPRTCYANRVSGFLFSADESRVFSQGFGSPEVFCWNVADATRLWEFWSACDWVNELLHEEDGNLLFVRGGFEVEGDVVCELNNQGKERILFKLNGFDSRAVRIDQSRVAVVLKHFGRKYDFEVRQLPSGKLISVTHLFEFDAKHLASHKNLVCVHDGYHLWIVDVTKPDKTRELTLPTKDGDLSIYFEGDTSLIVVSKTGIFRTTLAQSDWRKVVDFQASAVASGGVVSDRIPIAFEDGTVEIRSANDFSVIRTEQIVFEDATISACVLSASGNLLAIGASDGRMSLCTLV